MTSRFKGVRLGIVGMLWACLCHCQGTSADAPSDADLSEVDAGVRPTLRVLLIGNSYTDFNDLPTVIARLSQSELSPVRLEVDAHTPPDETWEEHNQNPTLDAKIALGWDRVVLQDQSNQAYYWQSPEIKTAFRSLDSKITEAGGQTTVFMTWSRRREVVETDHTYLWSNLTISRYYERHAAAVGGRVAPVGLAWAHALRADPTLRLHTLDESHPNESGSFLAACVIYSALTGASPIGLGDGGLNIPPDTVERLQRVAWTTLRSRQRHSTPRIGVWPLSDHATGNDLFRTDALTIGDTQGPTGAPGEATQFGLGKYAVIPWFAGLSPADISLSFHAFRHDWSATVESPQTLVAKWRGYEIHAGTDLSAQIYTVAGDVPPTPLTYSAADLAPGWHHFVLSYDGTTYALWIDETLVDSATASGALRYYESPFAADGPQPFNGIAIGGRPSHGPESILASGTFTGAISDLQLFDTALTPAEIQTLSILW